MDGAEGESRLPEQAAGESCEAGVKLITQRCDSARLLLDNQSEWATIDRGLVILISFANGATESSVQRAAQTVLTIPLITLGVWGDGTPPQSVVSMHRDGHDVSIMIIPQAAMTSRVKGKVLTYRDQLAKEESERFYNLFIDAIRAVATEELAPVALSGEDHGEAYRERVRAAQEKGRLDPQHMFEQGDYSGLYSQYDARGVPTHDNEGVELSKSHKKKLEKAYAAQSKRWAKYKDSEAPDHADQPTIEATTPVEQRDCPLKVVAGTFGNRQGYEVKSNMGPFTHMFSF